MFILSYIGEACTQLCHGNVVGGVGEFGESRSRQSLILSRFCRSFVESRRSVESRRTVAGPFDFVE